MSVALRGLEGARVLFAVLLPVFFPTVCFIESARKKLGGCGDSGSYLHGKPGSSPRSQDAQQVQNAVCLEFNTEILAQLKP